MDKCVVCEKPVATGDDDPTTRCNSCGKPLHDACSRNNPYWGKCCPSCDEKQKHSN